MSKFCQFFFPPHGSGGVLSFNIFIFCSYLYFACYVDFSVSKKKKRPKKLKKKDQLRKTDVENILNTNNTLEDDEDLALRLLNK